MLIATSSLFLRFSSTPAPSNDCNGVDCCFRHLGVEKGGAIGNRQLTASSQSDSASGPDRGRLNTYDQYMWVLHILNLLRRWNFEFIMSRNNAHALQIIRECSWPNIAGYVRDCGRRFDVVALHCKKSVCDWIRRHMERHFFGFLWPGYSQYWCRIDVDVDCIDICLFEDFA